MILRGQSNVDSEKAGVTEQEEGIERAKEKENTTVCVNCMLVCVCMREVRDTRE